MISFVPRPSPLRACRRRDGGRGDGGSEGRPRACAIPLRRRHAGSHSRTFLTHEHQPVLFGRCPVRRCSSSTGTSSAGSASVRRPAADFGGPISSSPCFDLRRTRTVTVRCSRSTSPRVRPNSSPRRNPQSAASITNARNRGETASANVYTCATVGIAVRSSHCSTPAPLIVHGFVTRYRSSTAVSRMARSSR